MATDGANEGWWAWLPDALSGDRRLSPTAKWVYAMLATWGGCPETRPSIRAIAERGAAGQRSIRRGLRELERAGHLETLAGGGRARASVYQLIRGQSGRVSQDKGGQLGRVPEPYAANLAGLNEETRPKTSLNAAKLAPQETKEETTPPLVEPAAGSTTDLFDLQKPAGKPTEREFLEAGRQVYTYFCEKLGHNPIVYTWTPKRRQMLHQRAREAYGMTVGFYPGLTPREWLERTVEAMRVAVNNFALSDWHQGRDPKTGGKKFVGIEYCFGSSERMQRWLMGG